MRWAIFLRAVNVGGTGKLPMAELRRALEAAGAQDVATYVQSGNVVLDHPAEDAARMAAWTGDTVEAAFGFRPGAMAVSADQLDTALQAHPWTGGEAKHVHFVFFTGAVDPAGPGKLADWCTNGEEMELGRHALYLHTPGGLGVSRLNGKIDRALGVETTTRNLNTVRKVRAMM